MIRRNEDLSIAKPQPYDSRSASSLGTNYNRLAIDNALVRNHSKLSLGEQAKELSRSRSKVRETSSRSL